MRQSLQALFSFLLLVGLSACAGLNNFQTPEARLSDMRMLQSSLLEQRILTTIAISNPNDAPLEVDGLRFKLEINDRPFATGMSGERVTVPRFGRAEIPAEASVALLDIFRQVMALPEREDMTYRLSGTLFLTGMLHRSADFEWKGGLRLAPTQGPGSYEAFDTQR